MYGSPYIETEHLLLGLRKEDPSLPGLFRSPRKGSPSGLWGSEWTCEPHGSHCALTRRAAAHSRWSRGTNSEREPDGTRPITSKNSRLALT